MTREPFQFLMPVYAAQTLTTQRTSNKALECIVVESRVFKELRKSDLALSSVRPRSEVLATDSVVFGNIGGGKRDGRDFRNFALEVAGCLALLDGSHGINCRQDGRGEAQGERTGLGVSRRSTYGVIFGGGRGDCGNDGAGDCAGATGPVAFRAPASRSVGAICGAAASSSSPASAAARPKC